MCIFLFGFMCFNYVIFSVSYVMFRDHVERNVSKYEKRKKQVKKRRLTAKMNKSPDKRHTQTYGSLSETFWWSQMSFYLFQVQTMQFLVVEPSPLSILIPLAQIFASVSCLNILRLRSSLNVRDHVSQPYSTTGNTIVLY